MNWITVDGRSCIAISYREFAASNLSEHGVAIFDYEIENCNKIKNCLSEDYKFKDVYSFILKVYNKLEKTSRYYFILVNQGDVCPFVFFDELRLVCGKLNLNINFYTCDFATDKIYKTSVSSMNEIGNLNLFPKILGLDKCNTIVMSTSKWAAPPGYYYFTRPSVFRSEAEKDFYNYKSSVQEKEFDTFYTIEDCKDKFDEETNTLNFHRNTILAFNLDDPTLTIKAILLKAGNLNIKQIKCDDLFCEKLECKKANCINILADKIVVESISADLVKTNYKYGVRIKGVKDEERI